MVMKEHVKQCNSEAPWCVDQWSFMAQRTRRNQVLDSKHILPAYSTSSGKTGSHNQAEAEHECQYTIFSGHIHILFEYRYLWLTWNKRIRYKNLAAFKQVLFWQHVMCLRPKPFQKILLTIFFRSSEKNKRAEFFRHLLNAYFQGHA